MSAEKTPGTQVEGALDRDRIAALLPAGSLFAPHLLVWNTVDSTNTRLAALAAQGAPHGTVLLAEEQTAGRGTHGRSFCSDRGDGLYLSLLLRPALPLQALLSLTGWVAVAVRDGIEAACGAPAQIKWLNDIYLNGRKLAGILTELVPGMDGRPHQVIVGVGVNVSRSAARFRQQGLRDIATSLTLEGYSISRNRLAAGILTQLDRMYRDFPDAREDYLARYRAHCLTLGRTVTYEADGRSQTDRAVNIDRDFALEVSLPAGGRRVISSGTVSVDLTGKEPAL